MATDRGYPWLKMYPILLDDPRWLRLSDGAKALYFQLYLLAGKADAGGMVVIGDDLATLVDIAFVLRRELEHIESQVSELSKSTLLTKTAEGLIISRFQAEQGPSQAEKREAWNERQRRKKAKALGKDKALEEEEEEEGSRDSRVNHGDATVTNPSTPSFQPSDPADRVWRMIKPSSLVIPPTLRESTIPVIDLALRRNNGDEQKTAAEGKTYFDAWCGRRGKDGKFYSPSGRGWIDWWAQGEIPANGKAGVPQYQETYE